MKILFAGTPWMAADILQALLTSAHEVVGVLTRTDAEIGRKRVLTASAVAQVAADAGIPVIKANRVDASVRSQISDLGAEFAVIVAYGAILDRAALELIPKGWTNIHYSLLPDWRGAAPVQRALAAGDLETGITLFDLDEGMDTGDVYLQVPTSISPDENAGDLLRRLGGLAVSALNELLPQIEAGLAKKVPQSEMSTPSGAARLAKKPTRQEARLDFNETALANERKVRAFNPEPVAWALWQNEPIRILSARSLGSTDWSGLRNASESVSANPPAPGAIHLEAGKVFVSCSAGTLLEIKEVQPAGKRAMSASEWVRGFGPDKKLWLE